MNKLYKTFNKNNVKISYSSIRNLGSIISSHIQRLLIPRREDKCLTPMAIYQADVTNGVDGEYKFYCGLPKLWFKEWFRNHTESFNHWLYQNNTELSKYIQTLKHQNKTPTIKWKIIQVVNSKVKLNFCKFCLTQKYYDIKALGNPLLLNKRFEFVNNCRHKRKLLLKLMKDDKNQLFQQLSDKMFLLAYQWVFYLVFLFAFQKTSE